MKRNWITGSFVLCSLFMANQALASDGVVHFTGEVIDSACEVTTDTIGQTVALGKVNRSAFGPIVGSTAAPTEFSIKLENCPPTYTQAAARFDGTEASDGNGDLAIGTPITASTPGDYTGEGTETAATGVAIRIYNRADNSQVKLYKDSSYTTIDSGNAELKFIARYISTSATVTPGTANADSQFTIEYMK
ncbi:chaperone-usher fimbrial major subunit [Enterobacter cloacae complex sp. P24RS]|uniref:chaperone-usher fimbrial major subunit n=1 Tax=Enterobacter cloacae complex sp. P24RS TaxID=2779568 RepID=UPI0018744384|nr:chaperone-usher fimbrial major subunit [Enterobacter cloacae complex sp. P24RS]MBE4964718.1 fimbrial protein [Enterobacter cloacae complex sp. P24RS]